MSVTDRWYFDENTLANSPSRKCGLDLNQELMKRQQSANLIKKLAKMLELTQLCINTAIVYMHRFYVFHSLTQFDKNSIACCALFLAAKVEELPRPLEHMLKAFHMCVNGLTPKQMLNTESQEYKELAVQLVYNENIMLLTLGFDIEVEHPHHFILICKQIIENRDLVNTSYQLANLSLMLTTMCLQYRPAVVSCVCIHLASKRSLNKILSANECKEWFQSIDPNLNIDLLEQLSQKFSNILDKMPERVRQRLLFKQTVNKNTSVVRTDSQTDLTVKPNIKYKKVVNSEGQTVRKGVPNGINKNKSSVVSTKTSINGSTKPLEDVIPNVVNRFNKKNLNMNLNLKITFSTVNDNKSIESSNKINNRIVCETTILSN